MGVTDYVKVNAQRRGSINAKHKQRNNTDLQIRKDLDSLITCSESFHPFDFLNRGTGCVMRNYLIHLTSLCSQQHHLKISSGNSNWKRYVP